MGTQAAFDLNTALDQWRSALAEQSLGRGEIQELEAHLHDTMAGLKESGALSDEEAFLVARRRLGGAEALGEQFRIAKPMLAWKWRALWMLIGVLVNWAVGSLSTIGSYGLLWLGSLIQEKSLGTDDLFRWGAALLTIRLLIWGGAGILLWKGAKSGILAKPAWVTVSTLLACLLVAAVILQVGAIEFSMWVFNTRQVRFTGAFLGMVSISTMWTPIVFLTGCSIWMCWKMKREQAVTPAAVSSNSSGF